MAARTHDSPPASHLAFEAFTHPYNQWYELYQRYYLEAIRRYAVSVGHDVSIRSMTRAPRILAAGRRIRYAAISQALARKLPIVAKAADAVAMGIAGPVISPATQFHHAVGQYVAVSRDATIGFCIDSHDAGDVRNQVLCEWSDVYFKTNYWGARSYPERVRPLPNCDPFVLRRLRGLVESRSAGHQYDICCVVRVWGGRDGIEGTEHNLRLLEAVQRVRCRKYIVAVLAIGEVQSLAARLERLGIPWTTRLISATDLWRVASVSCLNIVRLGVHYCVPWRLTGVLALGGVPVLDRAPFTVWPEPLRAGQNFLDLGIGVGPDAPLGADAEYAQAAQRIEAWIADRVLQQQIGETNAVYFDHHLAPERLGEHIVRAVLASTQSRRGE